MIVINDTAGHSTFLTACYLQLQYTIRERTSYCFRYCQRMQEENITRAIIVVQQGMTPSAKQSLVDMAPKYMLEQFMEAELMINITEHEVMLYCLCLINILCITVSSRTYSYDIR